MKKILLILVVAVMLSSVAFAQPYGEKSRPDSVGDIVFADGTATAWREGLTLTDAQKKAAVAVIFYVGTECSNGGERRVLGVGLENATGRGNTLAWAWTRDDDDDKAEGYEAKIEGIICTKNESKGGAATATFTGDLDGSDNWQILCEAVSDEETGGNYPSWEWVNAYAKNNALSGEYAQGWYLPTVAELCMLYRQKDTVNAALEAAGGTKISDAGDCVAYWSSSQSPVDSWGDFNFAWSVLFDDDDFIYHAGDICETTKHTANSVCAVRAF